MKQSCLDVSVSLVVTRWDPGLGLTSAVSPVALYSVLGDIITAINGTKVRNSSDLYKVLDKSMVRQSYNF
jgi:S1-C subfamily serine protease